MNRMTKTSIIMLSIFITSSAFANGGPFVLKYPNGDPAAKGVLARLDPDLRPGRETRLRVIKEDLKIEFGNNSYSSNNSESPPLAHISAQYTIENPTNEEIEVDFGFPILRGIYISPPSMMGTTRPSVDIRLGQEPVNYTIISNSAIYGIIRQRTREAIEKAIVDDQRLKNLIEAVRGTYAQGHEAKRKALYAYLVDIMNWNKQDASLMLEYASLDFGELKSHPPDRGLLSWWGRSDRELYELMNTNIGSLSAIGEQKATQFFAHLASCFESDAAAAYEAIFTAWGGDVRERSVDLESGKIRPREIIVNDESLSKSAHAITDPTIYARVDYLEPRAKLTESERASCRTILKNLPVIFTFAPMNILHYRVKFHAKSTQTLTVSYSQYAYADTRLPLSYQLAYVVHPASFWKEFGPINLEVSVPEGVDFRASENAGIKPGVIRKMGKHGGPDVFKGMVKNKIGEIYIAVDATSWKKHAVKAAGIVLNRNVQRAAQQSM